MKILKQCLRCGGNRHKVGTYCSTCVEWLQERHYRWAEHCGRPILDVNEPPRPTATLRPVCLEIDDICMAPPSLDTRLWFGFWYITGREG